MAPTKTAESQFLMTDSDSDETEFTVPEVLAQRSRYSRPTKRQASRTSALTTLTRSCLACRRLSLIVIATSVFLNVVLLVIVSRTNCYVDKDTVLGEASKPSWGASADDGADLTSSASRETRCGEGPAQRVEAPTDLDYVNVFKDLSREEITSAVHFMQNLTVHNVELYVPMKDVVLPFLDSPSRRRPRAAVPPREALVTVVLNSLHPPIVRQYVVGPLPHPSYFHDNARMSKEVSWTLLANNTYYKAYDYVLNLLGDMDVIMRESFGHTINDVNCGPSGTRACFLVLGQKVSFGLIEQPSHVFTLNYDAEFPTIHSLPLQIIVSENANSNSSGADIVVRIIYFAGSTFQSLADLKSKYRTLPTKVNLKYPENAPEETSSAGSMNLRGQKFPSQPHPAPRQYLPKGPRYSVVQQHIKYLQWSFNVRNSIESGPQAWDVRWAGERIAYEVSLQEIVVLYAGASPAATLAHLSDSAFGIGNNAKGMVPGVDCPDEATFLSTWAYVTGEKGAAVKELPNTVCIFEHNSGVPLRRHRSSDEGRYGGVVDVYLVVRSIIVEFNYDYIVDLIFHNNGAMEVRLYATGFIMSQWYHSGEDRFGYKVLEDIVGSVHHHLFHVKLDLDVGGLNNRYETLDFAVDESDWPWLSVFKPSALTSQPQSFSSSLSSPPDASRPSTTPKLTQAFQQISFKHHLRMNETDALYHYNFDTPKYHIFYSAENKNQHGNAKAYRLLARGHSKQLLPRAHPGLSSRKWADTCMAVTTRKEEEHKSSSIFSMYDGDDPVVDFEKFYKDDESIVDKDLVAWVTLGMHHIPHTEDIPNTPTVGTEASVLLLPYNYFPEDPSLGLRDAVRGDPFVLATPDPATPDTQPPDPPTMTFNTYGTERDFSCVPIVYDWFKPQPQSSRSSHPSRWPSM